MYPHRIRLAGPWQSELLAGSMRFRRRFGWVARMAAFERVWLRFDGVERPATVWLNGQLLSQGGGTTGTFEFDITLMLRARNDLLVEVEAATDDSLWGEVILVVRCTAFLRGVKAGTTPAEQGGVHCHVAGDVVGESDQPLDLYLLHAGRTVAQQTVEPSLDGRPFQFIAERPDPIALDQIRVELVNGATVWYVCKPGGC